jgi:chemotaxis protein MotB
LRIQIMDAANRPMFDIGSARLQPYFEDILLILAETIKAVPNKISISGHTDAKPYAGDGEFGNWELSAGRANAARRTLIAGGYPERQVARVVGYASSALFDRKDPFNPVNRRIDIIVLTKKAQRAIEGEQGDSDKPAAPEPLDPPAEGAAPPAPAEEPGVPVQPRELREKLNIFEDGVLNMDEPKGQ